MPGHFGFLVFRDLQLRKGKTNLAKVIDLTGSRAAGLSGVWRNVWGTQVVPLGSLFVLQGSEYKHPSQYAMKASRGAGEEEGNRECAAEEGGDEGQVWRQGYWPSSAKFPLGREARQQP